MSLSPHDALVRWALRQSEHARGRRSWWFPECRSLLDGDAPLELHPDVWWLPVVLPGVLHHGDRPWDCATNVRELFRLPASSRVSSEVLPWFGYRVLDLGAVAEEELHRLAATAITRLVLLLLKNARRQKDLAGYIANLGGPLREVADAPSGVSALVRVLSDTLGVADPGDREELVEILKREVSGTAGERAMGLKKMLMAIVEEKGRPEGARQLLLRQLHVRFGALDAEIADRIREADDARIERWSERILTARTLAEVFAG